VPSEIAAPTGLLRFKVKVSFGSLRVSPRTGTETFWLWNPGQAPSLVPQ